jgi:hypothetical protein
VAATLTEPLRAYSNTNLVANMCPLDSLEIRSGDISFKPDTRRGGLQVVLQDFCLSFPRTFLEMTQQ